MVLLAVAIAVVVIIIGGGGGGGGSVGGYIGSVDACFWRLLSCNIINFDIAQPTTKCIWGKRQCITFFTFLPLVFTACAFYSSSHRHHHHHLLLLLLLPRAPSPTTRVLCFCRCYYSFPFSCSWMRYLPPRTQSIQSFHNFPLPYRSFGCVFFFALFASKTNSSILCMWHSFFSRLTLHTVLTLCILGIQFAEKRLHIPRQQATKREVRFDDLKEKLENALRTMGVREQQQRRRPRRRLWRKKCHTHNTQATTFSPHYTTRVFGVHVCKRTLESSYFSIKHISLQPCVVAVAAAAAVDVRAYVTFFVNLVSVLASKATSSSNNREREREGRVRAQNNKRSTNKKLLEKS